MCGLECINAFHKVGADSKLSSDNLLWREGAMLEGVAKRLDVLVVVLGSAAVGGREE